MDLENILIVGIGVIIFLYSFSQRESYITVTFFLVFRNNISISRAKTK